MKRNSEETLQLAEMLTDASFDRIMAIDNNWELIAWNKTSENISGIQKADVLGRHLLTVFPCLNEDNEMIAAISAAMHGSTSFLPSMPGRFNRHFYENHFIPLEDESGTVIGVMNIIHDVAHRIKAEKQLQKLNRELHEKYLELEEANRELAKFTEITGNELKDPIRNVYTGLEFLVKHDGHRLSDGSRGGIRRMQASLNRINLLLSDILAVSAVSTTPQVFEHVNLNEVLDNVFCKLQEKISKKQPVIKADPLPTIRASKQMMYYLLYNLVDNALKFQPDEAVPHIHISASFNIASADPGAGTNKYVSIRVEDNGIGFEEADTEKIFNMFERVYPRIKYPGSGIGLTICRKIAQAHGGFIEAIGKPDAGATFIAHLQVIVQ